MAGCFTVRAVEHVNHRPHPFMVGTAAVALASRGSGILSKAVCDTVGCDWREGHNPGRASGPRCGLPTDAHKSDHVLCLSLVRHLSNAEATAALRALVPMLEADKLDGVVLIDTPEHYRVAPREESHHGPNSSIA